MIRQDEASKHVEDPKWLQAQAHADLLQWNYDGAIKEIDDALMLNPNDPDLLVDKATALYERAKKLGISASIDYGEAAENLAQALKKNRDDPIALFNRAIVYEEMSLPHDAIADCEHY